MGVQGFGMGLMWWDSGCPKAAATYQDRAVSGRYGLNPEAEDLIPAYPET